MVKIFIDPGHGGADPGAVGNGIREADIVLSIGLKLRSKLLLNYSGIDVVMSRDTNKTVLLSERTNKANGWGADIYVSIHINSSSTMANGFETFTHPNQLPRTVSFQNIMHQEIMRQIRNEKINDRGKKQANFHVLRETNMSAILTENLFINNPSEAAKLKSDSFLDKLAEGHAVGLERFFGLTRKTTPTADPDTNLLFQVITGTYAEREHAEAQLEKLKKDGYESYIQVKNI